MYVNHRREKKIGLIETSPEDTFVSEPLMSKSEGLRAVFGEVSITVS